MMTFAQFQASRRDSADIGKAISQPEWFSDEVGNDRAAAGFVYDGDCFIERLEDGRFYLVIGNMESISETLEPLELELYQWATDEGLMEDAA